MTGTEGLLSLTPKYCRTCAAFERLLIPIFADDDLSKKIHRVIEKHLPIKVCEDDELPLEVCQKCANTLSAWYELVEGVLNAEKTLTDILRQNEFQVDNEESIVGSGFTSDAGADSDNQPLIQMAVPKKKKERTKKDLQIDKEMPTMSSNLGDRLDIEDGNQTKGADKDFCTLCMKSVRKLEVHIQKHDWWNDMSLRFCPACGEGVSRSEELCQHLYSHVNRIDSYDEKSLDVHQCQICLDKIEGLESMVRHMAIHVCRSALETPRATVHCMVCGKGVLRATLPRHVASHVGSRRWTCHDCGKHYAQESGLVRHLRVFHEGLRRYKCPICSTVFQSQAELQNHQNAHTDPRPFQCDSCGRTFRSKKDLHFHRRYHHTENGLTVTCRTCDRAFSSSSALRRHHKTVHLRLKEFLCEICNAQLTTKQYLLEHLRTHTNERPEVCGVCGKTFQMSGNLRQHMKTHKERVHVCHNCGKRFARRCQLVIHMRSHRGLPPLLCACCNQQFLLKIDLQRHLKTSHNNSTVTIANVNFGPGF